MPVLSQLKISLRLFSKTPVVSAVSILTLAIAFGAVIAAFTIVNCVFLRPLPFTAPQNLVAIESLELSTKRPGYSSMADFLTYQKDLPEFPSIAAYRVSSFALADQSIPEQINGCLVTKEFFATLGIAPLRGRFFEDPDPDGEVVLSYSYWERRYHLSANAIGRPIVLDNLSTQIIGIAPRSFWFPDQRCNVWRLMTPAYPLAKQDPDFRFLHIVGRLDTRVSVRQAQTHLALVRDSLAAQDPSLNGNQGAKIEALDEEITVNIKPFLNTFTSSAVILLLIVCVNISNLQLSRSEARIGELAVRVSLGAGRRELFYQLMVENLILTLGSGILAIGLSLIAIRVFLRFCPFDIPRSSEIVFDRYALLSVLLLAVVIGLVLAAIPSLRVRPGRLLSTLSRAARGSTGAPQRKFMETMFVIVEDAASLVLVASVFLLIRSYKKQSEADMGFVTKGLAVASVKLDQARYPDQAALNRFQRTIYDRILQLNSVSAVAGSSCVPLVRWFEDFFAIRGHPAFPPARQPMVAQCSVSPNYFRTMGIPVREGREFSEHDNESNQRVAIINEAMARLYWTGASPIGAQVRLGIPPDQTDWYTIIGIYGSTRPLVEIDPRPTIYTPFLQLPPGYENELGRPMALFVRTSLQALSISGDTRAVIAGTDPTLAAEIRSMDDIIEESLSHPRFRTVLMGILAFMAVWISSIGTFAVISGIMASHKRETALRLAMGATPSQLVLRAIWKGLAVMTTGLIFGLLLSVLFAKVFQGMLFQTNATDHAALIYSVTLLSVINMIAIVLPTRRIIRAELVATLKEQ